MNIEDIWVAFENLESTMYGPSPKGDGTGPVGPGYIILKHYYSDDKLSDNLPLIYDNH